MFVAVAVAGIFAACAQSWKIPPTVPPSESAKAPQPMGQPPAPPKPSAAVGYEVGNAAPSFALPDTDGTTVSLTDFAGKPLVLVFYRGQWWPYCSKQLGELQKQIADFESAGVAILGVSVDAPEDSKPLKERLGLTFPLSSDVDRSVIKAYNVFHDAMNIAYPGTFVLDGSGIIRWKYVRTQKADRPPTATVLEQAKLAAGSGQ